MSEPQTVYLSGPISLGGTGSEAVVAAFSAVFRREARRLRSLGFTVIDPTEVEGDASWPWERWMRYGLHAVADADVVAVLPRWNESRGAMLEAFVASQLSIPVVPVAEIG